jgi:RNA polymerase sigma factor (sigma-70 family)
VKGTVAAESGLTGVARLATHMQTVCIPTTEYGAVPIPEHSRHPPWRDIVEGIVAGQAPAEHALYQALNRTARPLFLLQLGSQHADDLVPDLFLTVLQSIRAGRMRDAECLMGYVLIIARRMVARTIRRISVARSRELSSDEVSLWDPSGNPEQERQRNETLDLMRTILSKMTPQTREILHRFYLDEQPVEEICREMRLTKDQFRLLKWRAKARFGALARKRLAGGMPRIVAIARTNADY